MKQYINKLLITALGSVIMAGCADTGIDDFSVEKPNTIAGMEYLNDYSPLKSYINRTAHPNFKLGSGISESDFNSGGIVYRLASANFDEITAGNAMKYSSCVSKDGVMSFSDVTKFIEMAKKMIDKMDEFVVSRACGSNTKQGCYYSIHPEKHLEVKVIISKKHRYSANEENEDFDDS
jgi:hypothetical protein